jgi:outer membrane cobalamin receptor
MPDYYNVLFALCTLLVGGLLLSPPASAQTTGTIEGRVVDAEDGAPLPGANVVVEGTSLGTSTNESGRFTLSGVPTGSQTVRISFVSYEDTEKTVDVDSGRRATLTVRLQSQVTEAGEVVVTGIRESQMRSVNQKKQAPNVVDALSADDIGNLPEKNVAEAVQRLPGIVLKNDRTEGRFVSIRGGASNLNNVTLNGNALASTAGSRATALDLLPAEMVSNVEVT